MLWSSLLIELQPTIGLKPPLQILVWKCSEKKRCSKISKIPKKKTLKNCTFFSKVTGLQTRIPDLTKTDSNKNVLCEYSEIIGNLPDKGIMSAWVLIPPSKPQPSNFFCPSRQTKSPDKYNMLHMFYSDTYAGFRTANKHVSIPS